VCLKPEVHLAEAYKFIKNQLGLEEAHLLAKRWTLFIPVRKP